MKNLATKSKWLFTAVILLSALLVSNMFASICGSKYVGPLVAGQSITFAGDIEVWNDEVNLYVKFKTNGPNALTETHLAVGCSPEDLPHNKKSNPVPGRFPISSKFDLDPPIYEITYTIPLADIGCSEIYIAAHAVIQCLTDLTKSETAWGGGCLSYDWFYFFPESPRWAFIIVYTVQPCVQ